MENSNRLLHAANAFQSNANQIQSIQDYSITAISGGYNRLSSNYLRGYIYNRTDLIKSVISRIALEVSQMDFKHLKIDSETGDQTPIPSNLIDCLTSSANIDQTGSAFMYDLSYSLLDEGVIAAVAIDTSVTLNDTGSYDVSSLRVGRVMQWYPQFVRVRCYNENTGLEQDLILGKKQTAIIESPMYMLLKGENQTLRLLQQKINLMNSQDTNAASGKLNGFLQVPYATKAPVRQEQAQKRKAELEREMSSSRYGLATLDAQEKYIPAGAGLENNLLADIRRLQQDFYDQTGITENVLNGTAAEPEMNLFYHRSVEPVAKAIMDAMNRIYLTKTARSQGQKIFYYRDPFKSLPIADLATAADLFTRNAIFTPNEIRQFVGKPPHPDPKANMLFNRNIADGNQYGTTNTPGQGDPNMPLSAQQQDPNDPNAGDVDPNSAPTVQSPYGQALALANQKNARTTNYQNTHTSTGSSINIGGK